MTGATATPGTGASAAPAVGAISAPAGGANQALESRVKTESVGGANAAPAAPVTGRQIFGSGEPEVQYLGARPRVPNQGDDLANNLFKEKMHYSSNISLIKSVMLPKILIFVTHTNFRDPHPALKFCVTLPLYGSNLTTLMCAFSSIKNYLE